jgi:hypothetical protein
MEKDMAREPSERDPTSAKVEIDIRKLRQGIDDLLQRDQLDNDKEHASNKPGGTGGRQPAMPDEGTAAELNRDHHD